MLDLGWAEILIVAVAALIVVGPKDLPRMLRTLGQYAARAKSVAREFQRSMDDAARQADLDELRDVKKDLDKDVAGVRDAQYKMQREMSQSFLDEGKKPKATGEKTAEAKAGTKPDTGKAETAKPDTAKPDTAKPDTAKPDTTKPDTTKPETGKTSAGKRAADKPGNGDGAADGKGGAARADNAPGKAPAAAPPDRPAADEPAAKPSAGKVGGA